LAATPAGLLLRDRFNGSGARTRHGARNAAWEFGSYIVNDFRVDYMVNKKYCFAHVSGAVVWT
jgi:hypothetical protein